MNQQEGNQQTADEQTADQQANGQQASNAPTAERARAIEANGSLERAVQTGAEANTLEELLEVCKLEEQRLWQPGLETPAVSSASSPGEDQIYPGDE